MAKPNLKTKTQTPEENVLTGNFVEQARGARTLEEAAEIDPKAAAYLEALKAERPALEAEQRESEAKQRGYARIGEMLSRISEIQQDQIAKGRDEIELPQGGNLADRFKMYSRIAKDRDVAVGLSKPTPTRTLSSGVKIELVEREL